MKYNPQKHHRKSIRLNGYDYAQPGLYFVTICCQNRAHLFGQIEKGTMIFNDAGPMIAKWYVELENKFPDIKCCEMVIMPNHFHCIIQNVRINNTVPNVGADLRVCPKIKLNDPNEHNLNKPELLGESNKIELGEHNGNYLNKSELLDETNKIELGEHNGNNLNKSELLDKTNKIILDEHNGNYLNKSELLDETNKIELGEHNGNNLDKPESLNKPNKIKLDEHNGNYLNKSELLDESNKIILGEHNGNNLDKSKLLGEHIGSPLHRVVQWFKTMTTNEYIRGVKNYNWKRFDGKLWQRNYWEHIIRNQNEYKLIAEYILNNPQNWQNDKLIK